MVERPDSDLQVVPHSARWTGAFDEIRVALQDALGSTALSIEHIGSTAVSGLAAKPTIDVLAVVGSIEEFLTKLPAIERLGFSYRANNTMVGTENHLFLRRVVGGRRTHHLHVVVDGAAEIEDYRLFRDALRADRTFAEEYERYKLQLASKYAKDECPTSPRNRTGWVPA